MSLIKEINDLRRELKLARTSIHDLEAVLGLHSTNNKKADTATLAQLTAKNPSAMMERDLAEKNKVIEMQRYEISRLRSEVTNFESGSRPPSGSKLLPIQGAA